ncbi:MAG: hypothetical protein JO285_13895, partial [Kutzneria sp.]|nr:hypothetical protein [Kutzneria sp.]
MTVHRKGTRWVRGRRRTPVLAVAAALTIALAACGAGGNYLRGPNQTDIGHNDINPHPASDIKDGGTLRWPVGAQINNWNRNQVDGATRSAATIQNTMFPWLFTKTPDTSVKLNPDYLTSATMLSTDPEVIEYKLNPK